MLKLSQPAADKGIVGGLVKRMGTFRVIALACVSIAVAIFVMVGIAYAITQNAVVERLHSKDLVFIVRSIAAKVDGRIARAQETSRLMARDPAILAWTMGMEQDQQLREMVLHKIADVAQQADYSNSFIVSNLTKHYWTESGQMIDTMSEQDPDDSWFFDTMRAGQPVSISIDYNNERENTYVFVNALMGDSSQPIGVAGVGLDLQGISNEIASYQFGDRSNLWLIDSKGKIHLSEDLEDRGKSISDLIPEQVARQILQQAEEQSSYGVLAYRNSHGEQLDLIHQPMQSTDWQIVLQIPRAESMSFLNTIKTNLLMAAVVSLLLIALLFYLVSTRIANPFQRALLINRELENQVERRTQELHEKNTRIMDSIEYAKRLQDAVVPAESELSRFLREHFVLWKPRDLVGGDFYWSTSVGDGVVLAVADCTGHGVPGALMTMAATSILNYVVDEHNHMDPSAILHELNLRFKESLHKHGTNSITDDGMDIGICCFNKERLVFSGAKVGLYVHSQQGTHFIPGARHSLGYHRSRRQINFTNTILEIEPTMSFYLTTDGFLDQNGGERDFPFGRRRLLEALNLHGNLDMRQQHALLEQALREYMGENDQRDDLLVLGFRL